MSARIDEKTQFVDSAGVPIVNGKIYIGLQGADPVLNPISIFSDRELTIALANPQLTDSNGRSVNKIWIPGDYSIRVDDSLDVQQMIDLDAGETVTDSGVTPLSNVTGTNTIAAEASPTITAYVDQEIYVLQAVNNNSAAVTLNIDLIGAKPVRINLTDELVADDFIANGSVVVIYNLGQDVFEWINQNTANLESNLLVALQPTGLCQTYVGDTAPTGWVLCDGGTIGNATSGGTTRANADTEPLFTVIYNAMADAQAPVSGGRTTGAAADYALNKTITIPDLKGAVPFGFSNGTTNFDPLGASGGEEDHTLIIDEMPAHDHDSSFNSAAPPRSGGGTTGGGANSTQTSTSTGGGLAHENMPPFVVLNWVLKL